jgi:hypothetical protein
MKRISFLLLGLFFYIATVTMAGQKMTDIVFPVTHERSAQADAPGDMTLLIGFELFHKLDLKKLRMEEDGRHLTFNFQRIRNMKWGCGLCSFACKLFLGLVHMGLIIMMFTHIFH